MNVLVLNCGSSTVKFQLIQTDLDRIRAGTDRQLARGVLERIGSQALITIRDATGAKTRKATPLRDHKQAIQYILEWVASGALRDVGLSSPSDIQAAGHRVVHGGEKFQQSVAVDRNVMDSLEECIELAPLHNPANLRGIRAVRQLLGEAVTQVAVFDTAFHATMPESSYLYGIPYQFYRRYKIRRYGFHGTSHRYVAYRYRLIRAMPRDRVNIITLHLGNGCSACLVQGGDSYDTSMGFTPLEGLLMGTRCGDLDASLVEFIAHKEGLSFAEVDSVLNKHSGLLGLSGITADMRELLEEEAEYQDRRAKLAIEIFCRRVRKYIGAYVAEARQLQSVVFAGGIGENSADIRGRICRGLEKVGLELDPVRNSALAPGGEGVISTGSSPIEACVIPTNEELLIARDTVRVIKGDGGLGREP